MALIKLLSDIDDSLENQEYKRWLTREFQRTHLVGAVLAYFVHWQLAVFDDFVGSNFLLILSIFMFIYSFIFSLKRLKSYIFPLVFVNSIMILGLFFMYLKWDNESELSMASYLAVAVIIPVHNSFIDIKKQVAYFILFLGLLPFVDNIEFIIVAVIHAVISVSLSINYFRKRMQIRVSVERNKSMEADIEHQTFFNHSIMNPLSIIHGHLDYFNKDKSSVRDFKKSCLRQVHRMINSLEELNTEDEHYSWKKLDSVEVVDDSNAGRVSMIWMAFLYLALGIFVFFAHEDVLDLTFKWIITSLFVVMLLLEKFKFKHSKLIITGLIFIYQVTAYLEFSYACDEDYKLALLVGAMLIAITFQVDRGRYALLVSTVLSVLFTSLVPPMAFAPFMLGFVLYFITFSFSSQKLNLLYVNEISRTKKLVALTKQWLDKREFLMPVFLSWKELYKTSSDVNELKTKSKVYIKVVTDEVRHQERLP